MLITGSVEEWRQALSTPMAAGDILISTLVGARGVNVPVGEEVLFFVIKKDDIFSSLEKSCCKYMMIIDHINVVVASADHFH
jgi:hypothetical protein